MSDEPELDPNADCTPQQWESLQRIASKNAEKAAKVYAEHGLRLNDMDVLRHKMECMITYMLGERTNARFHFEKGFQEQAMAVSLEGMHNAGVQRLQELKEAAVSDPQARQELMALQQHRHAHGVPGDIMGILAVKKPGLIVPMRGQ